MRHCKRVSSRGLQALHQCTNLKELVLIEGRKWQTLCGRGLGPDCYCCEYDEKQGGYTEGLGKPIADLVISLTQLTSLTIHAEEEEDSGISIDGAERIAGVINQNRCLTSICFRGRYFRGGGTKRRAKRWCITRAF